MPSSLATILMAFGFLFAVLSFAIPAVAFGSLAVAFEIGLFIFTAIAGPDSDAP